MSQCIRSSEHDSMESASKINRLPPGIHWQKSKLGSVAILTEKAQNSPVVVLFFFFLNLTTPLENRKKFNRKIK